MWNEIVENLKEFFNQPVAIIGCSLGFLLILILVILSKTSIGRRALKKLTLSVTNLVAGYNELKLETESKIKELEKSYEEKKSIIESKVAILEEVCLIVAENSHNAKVKEAMEQCKEKLSICKTGYETVVEEKVKEEKEKIEAELKSKYDEFYETYLKGKKEEIEQLVKEAENSSQIIQNKANSLVEEVVETKEEIVEVIKDEEGTHSN